MEFEQAFKRLVNVERGYVNDPQDPGGETNLGISKRSYPQEDIPNMTLDRAMFLYKRDFWLPCGADRLPPEVKYDVFDAAVNSGVGQSLRLLQRACGAEADGVLGPQTLRMAAAMNGDRLSRKFNGHRLIFMTGLKTWPRFSGGWAIRVGQNLIGED